jgi:hypothetical protein
LHWGSWLALGLALQGCKTQEPGRPAAIAFMPSTLDLGVLVQNERVHGTVELRNLGRSPLHVRFGASGARCGWQGGPDTIAARTTLTIAVDCQSDLLGPLKEALTVLDASQGDVLATLPIVGRVDPVIGFDTAFVDLRPGFGQTTSAEIRLVGKRAGQATARVTSTGGDLVTAVPMSPDGGLVRGFRVSCNGNRVGMHAGSLAVDTGIAEHPTLSLSWGCRVPATLDVEPANPIFNLRASGDRATTLAVTSSRSGFRVKSARVIAGPFRASLERPNPDGSTPITIRVANDQIPDEARAATGRLLIESNDEREPLKEVPLFGFGKVNKAERPAAD